MKRSTPLLLSLLLTLVCSTTAFAANKAGVAVKDATWHVGASGGQFADDTGPVTEEDTFDPSLHSTKKRISDGVGLRTSTRALVFEDREGDRVAIVSTDLYLPQDFLVRRVAKLLEEHDATTTGPKTGITYEKLAVTASHNHNTPYYSTPGWGTAIFQDVYDLRFYDYMARQIAGAVIEASKAMVPVRMGGATRTFNEIQSHTYGPKVGDDGTPAGQPYSHTTQKLSVVRLDDITNPRNPKPFAHWVVFGVHPEYTWGYDLINGDITHAAARMVDRELRTTSVFTQRETGSSGPHKDERVHNATKRREFQDNGFNNLDRAARLLADGIKATLKDIENNTPQHANAFQPFVTDFDVASVSKHFSPPATRPYPGVSNCNTASLFHGDPRVPVLGLPDCARTSDPPDPAPSQIGDLTRPVTEAYKPITSPMYDQLKEAGVPIPESYSGTALTAVEETNAVHLMAIKLGGIVATICPCEQFTDTALNLETRLDRVAGNIWKGFDWAATKTPTGRNWCVPGTGLNVGKWSCANPQSPASDLPPITDTTYRRFRAQINNDAAGWETDLATLGSEAEPANPALIKGNFTHEEFPANGYNLVLAVGMANDYWGYTPEYREMRSADHYRKALNGLGLHGADFLATRLGRMGASLNGGSPVALSALDQAMLVEQARASTTANGLGEIAEAYTPVYDAAQPADGGTPGPVAEPVDVTRFGAAHFSWTGGSNYIDLPDVVVERRVGSLWLPYGDTTGDIQLMVGFPKVDQLQEVREGAFEWKWTASFEAFASDVAQADAQGVARDATPAGLYRFRVSGHHRAEQGGKPAPYGFRSREFTVAPWDGLSVRDLRVDSDGAVSFEAPVVAYPDSYASPFRYIENRRTTEERGEQYCPRCAFRPWADSGTLDAARVTITAADGTPRTVAALPGADGRWRTAATLAAGERARIAAGGLTDRYGNVNGTASAQVSR